jgi:hypothetical protein
VISGSIPADPREREIERLWQTCEPLTPKPLPEGFAIGFRQEMRNLVVLKRDLPPTVRTFLTNAQLEAVDEATDRLIVTTGAGVEEFSIHCRPDPTWTPSFRQRLSRLHNDTDELADWVFEMRRVRELTHEDAAEVAVLCGMRRVELTGYRALSALWHAKQTAPSEARDWRVGQHGR